MATINIGNAGWDAMLMALLTTGELTSTGVTTATLRIDNFGGAGVHLVWTFTGSGIGVDTGTDRFTGGSFTSMSVLLGGASVVNISYNGSKNLSDEYNTLKTEAMNNPSSPETRDAFYDVFLVENTTVNGSTGHDMFQVGGDHSFE